MNLQRTPARLAVPAILGITLFSAGCANTLNVEVPVFQGGEATVTGGEVAPSVTGLSRDHWPHVALNVPARQVQVNPTYFRSVEYAHQSARQRGDYPTIDTVLEEPGDGGPLQAEAAVGHVHALGSVFLFPFKMFFVSPGSIETAPALPYDRTQNPMSTGG